MGFFFWTPKGSYVSAPGFTRGKISVNKPIHPQHPNGVQRLSPGFYPGLLLFDEIISRCVKVVKNTGGPLLLSLKGQAHPKDIPILAAALKSGARFLVTFNVKHYHPSPATAIEIIRPGELLREIREYFLIK